METTTHIRSVGGDTRGIHAAREAVRAYLRSFMGERMFKPGMQSRDRIAGFGMMILRAVPGSNAPLADGYLDDHAGPIIELALAGDKDARKALKGIARAHLEADRPIPAGLATYLARLEVKGPAPAKPGSHPDRYKMRDALLPGAIWVAVKEGVKAHRGSGKHHEASDQAPSACAIVKEELERLGIHMSEKSVEDIWAARDRELFREIEHKLLDELPPELRQAVLEIREGMSRTT